MEWKIDKDYGITHFHNPIYVAVGTSPLCRLCKEKVPNHIILQDKLLGFNLDEDPGIDVFIDYYITTPKLRFDYFHYPTHTLSLRCITFPNLHEPIIKVFKQFLSKELTINYPYKY